MLLIIALFSFGGLIAQPIKIVQDKTQNNGHRLIITDYVSVNPGFIVRGPLVYIALGKFSSEDEHSWQISLAMMDYHQYQIPQDGLLLIKLEDDNIIELKQVLPLDETDDIAGKYQSSSHKFMYTTHGIYNPDISQIQEIIEKGVKKIRIEHDTDFIDINYKKDKFGSIIKRCYDSIQEASLNKRDVRSDF